MKRIMLMIYATLIFLGIALVGTARAQYDQSEPGDYLLSPEELDELLAPIALYPDPLLAQILPAATFIDQIDEATRYVRQYGNTARIDDQPWDVSVKAVAHYPEILSMMDQKYDWTASLGQAFINQEQDVMDAIQRLRAEAEDAGNLRSTAQQQVYYEDDSIRIVPVNAELIYVPQYDPAVIYYEPAPSFGFITFGIGLTIGAWLDRDCDWRNHRVYYHGWQGGGWIGRARPHIHDRRNVYINSNIASINVNRAVIRHDTANFRDQLQSNAHRRMAQPPARAVKTHEIKPGEGKPGVRREAPAPFSRVTPPAVSSSPPAGGPIKPPKQPDISGFYRGRVTQGPQPAARSGYGGYGSSRDASVYSQRGQASRVNMGRFNQPQLPPAQGQRPVTSQPPSHIQQAPKQAAPTPTRQAPPAVRRQAPPARHGGEQQMKDR